MEHTQRVLEDLEALVPMGGVTIPGAHTREVDFKGLYLRRDFFVEKAKAAGLQVIEMKEDAENPCPFVIITFPEMIEDGNLLAKVALVGHIDVVDAKHDLFKTEIEGDYIKGRGTTDMLGVDATFLEWMIDRQKKGGKKPPFVLMFSATEENDSQFGHNTYTAKEFLEKEYNADLEFAVVGERTGEMTKVDQPVASTIRDSNYGLRRYSTEAELINPNKRDVERMLKIFSAKTIGLVRNALDLANQRDDQGTTFANPYFTFESPLLDGGIENMHFANYKVDAGSSTKHSAQSKPGEKTPLESGLEYVELLKRSHPNLQILRIGVGTNGNYNTVSDAIDIDLALGHRTNINLDGEPGLNGIGRINNIERPNLATRVKVKTGIEVRESPEHASLVGRLIADVNNSLNEFGTKLDIVTLRSGWKCDPRNPHLRRLQDAVHEVTGMAPRSAVKVFFNDGAAFIEHGHHQHGSPIARAVIFGQTGFAPHGDLERHYIPSIETGWNELDAFADQYLSTIKNT